jgi:hypothetical protein
MNPLRMIATLVAVTGMGLLAIPSSSAHCLKQNVHMNGSWYQEWGRDCSSYSDTGCIYIGTISPSSGSYCSQTDPWTQECTCEVQWYNYNCDGCDEGSCSNYPHEAYVDKYGAYQCLPSCGAAGGNTCATYGGACSGYTEIRSFDCQVCCAR